MKRALLALALSGCAAQSLPTTSTAMSLDRKPVTSIVYSNRFIAEDRLCVFDPSRGYRVPVIQVQSENGQIISLTVHNELQYSPLNVWLNDNSRRAPDAQVGPGAEQTFTIAPTSQVEIEQAFIQGDGGPGAALTLGKL